MGSVGWQQALGPFIRASCRALILSGRDRRVCSPVWHPWIGSSQTLDTGIRARNDWKIRTRRAYSYCLYESVAGDREMNLLAPLISSNAQKAWLKQQQQLIKAIHFQTELSDRFEPAAMNGTSERSSMAAADRAKFLEVYEKLKVEILAEKESFQHTEESRVWVEQNMDYNVPGGKLNRGLSVIDSVRILKEGEPLTEEETFRACALGWCIEWLQGYFLVMDDIMDHSITRRGKPCWYKVPKVGLIAINDAIVLNSHIFLILKRHFRQEPYYVDLIDLFNEVTFQTASGQMLDLITTPEGEVDLSKYTLSTYLRIVQFKTAYYSFYLPVACALWLVGEKDPSKFAVAKDILIQMGTYFQVQDDFLDCYGDPAVIGKVGTDIEDTKCSWLVVQALQRASAEQREVLKANYGKSDPECVKVIKDLYGDLKLKEAFEQYEAESYKQLTAGIAKESSLAFRAVFLSFLGKIYKRQK